MHERGYILVYAILTIAVMLVVTTSVSRSALSQFFSSRDTLESARAILAAESAIECILAHDLDFEDEGYYPFDTWSPVSLVTCYAVLTGGALSQQTFQVGNVQNRLPEDLLNCYDAPYTPAGGIQLGSNDGPCAKLNVTVRARPIPPYATLMCDVSVEAYGYNTCSNPTVERVRWTHLVPEPLIES